jgi:hypothetical protein
MLAAKPPRARISALARLAERQVAMTGLPPAAARFAEPPLGGPKDDIPSYRVYFVGSDGHFKATTTIFCATDDEALDIALAGIGHFAAVEVWCGERRLGRISPSEQYPD